MTAAAVTRPNVAEDDAWYVYQAAARADGRTVDERTFREGWHTGCVFTFTATSKFSPAIEVLATWLQYIAAWSPPGAPPEDGAA